MIFLWRGCVRKSSILKKILPVFSYLFHPLFIPLMAVAVFLYSDGNYFSGSDNLLILIQVLIMTTLIPIAFYFLLKTLGKIDTVMAREVGQRKIPLLLQTILLVLLISQSLTPERVPELFFFFTGAAITSLAALISAYANMKPSLHMAASGAMLLFFIGLSIHDHQNMISLIALTLVVNGLVASSRLEMKAHTNIELLSGFAIGVVPQIALWQYWL